MKVEEIEKASELIKKIKAKDSVILTYRNAPWKQLYFNDSSDPRNDIAVNKNDPEFSLLMDVVRKALVQFHEQELDYLIRKLINMGVEYDG